MTYLFRSRPAPGGEATRRPRFDYLSQHAPYPGPTDATMQVLIVDDHPITCEGLKSLLQVSYPGSRIEARQSADGLAACVQDWDYVFLDMHLPDSNCQDLLRAMAPWLARVILISAAPEADVVEFARQQGARGLLLKNADVGHILDGFRRIQAGESVFDDTSALSGGRHLPTSALTGRQHDVYAAVVSGLSNKQIARKLGISEFTVKEHVTAILAVYGVRNRMELVLQQHQPVV